MNSNRLYHLVLAGLLAGVIGARLAYALQSPQAFLASPLSLLNPRPQMLDPTGGLVAAALAALIYGQRQKMALWATLDALVSLFAVMAVALAFSHLASGDAFGAPTRLPWAVPLWGELRHPSQIYEILAALLIGIVVWQGVLRPSTPEGAFPAGLRFWLFVSLSAAARLFLEAFRGDSVLLFDRFRLAQVAAWVVLAVGLWQIGRRIAQLKAVKVDPTLNTPGG